MTNIQLARKVVNELVLAGVREFCLCAGARNSPLVLLLEQSKDLKIYNFFEERSAAFFALGRIAATDLPVAVITTSGTAVAEMLPAAVEATYSSLQLIMVSADRPKSYRGSGAPQTIEQVGIFSYYIEATFDLDEENSHISLKSLTYKKPIHINVCFNEPLLDDEIHPIAVKNATFPQKFPESVEMSELKDVRGFLSRHRPIIILGHLPEVFHKTVRSFLQRMQLPVFAETISGFRGDPELESCLLVSGEKMVEKLVEDQVVDSVIRIGGVPTLRFWRDLEEKYSHIPALSLSYNYYTGLSRNVTHFADLYCLESVKEGCRLNWETQKRIDRERRQSMEELFQKFPQAEPSLFNKLSKKIGSSSVFLGNSLPIREWDLFAADNIHLKRSYANRGANGIDGQLSTFLGWAAPGEENWCIVGDLTAMYDLSAPWIATQMQKSKKLRVVIINNRGGQIFKRVFKKDIFLNRHSIQFKSWAEMWGWNYHSTSDLEISSHLGIFEVIEVHPSEEQTEKFWSAWDQIWSNK